MSSARVSTFARIVAELLTAPLLAVSVGAALIAALEWTSGLGASIEVRPTFLALPRDASDAGALVALVVAIAAAGLWVPQYVARVRREERMPSDEGRVARAVRAWWPPVLLLITGSALPLTDVGPTGARIALVAQGIGAVLAIVRSIEAIRDARRPASVAQD